MTRWMVFSKRGRVAHAIDEVSTGWSRSEISGSLISECGRDSSEAWATYAETGTMRCLRCCKSLDEPLPVTTKDPLPDVLRDLVARWRTGHLNEDADEILTEIEIILERR